MSSAQTSDSSLDDPYTNPTNAELIKRDVIVVHKSVVSKVKNSGLTNKSIAKKIGMNESSFSKRMHQEVYDWPWSYLERISKVLGMGIGELVGNNEVINLSNSAEGEVPNSVSYDTNLLVKCFEFTQKFYTEKGVELSNSKLVDLSVKLAKHFHQENNLSPSESDFRLAIVDAMM